MNDKKNISSKLVSSIIALVNSLILLIKSVAELSDNNSVLDYFIIFFYFIILIVSGYICVESIKCFVKFKKSKIKVTKKTEISRSLIQFMDNGGRTAILSRNLSWITDDFIGKLEKKSKDEELIVFIPKPNEVSERLKKAGADVRYFGSLISDSADSVIKSRFTIIQWDSTSARITYPKQDHLYHYNFEYVIGDPTMDLAQDLIRLLIKLVPESREEEKNENHN